MKVLVLGASGMLGTSLVPHLSSLGHEVLAHSRNGTLVAGLAADLSSAAEAARLVHEAAPHAVVNLAGLVDVDRCESHPKDAWLANVRSVENIASACSAAGARLVHISTDQVYDHAPSSTESQACPGNQYAMTKYAGELAALSAAATVLRTNFFGASRHATRRSLTDWLFAALGEGRPVPVFNDVRFSPLSLSTLCEAIATVLATSRTGIFNLGSRGGMSKAEFAFAFAAALGFTAGGLVPGTSSASAALKAWRPKDMCMDSTLFTTTFGLALPTLGDDIQRAAKDYREYR